MNVYDENGKRVQLGPVVGRGGEAVVYRLNGQPGWLAKIYEPAPRPNYPAKLAWMIDYPPDNPTGELDHPSFAWPAALLGDAQGRLVGYLMPHIQQAVPILAVFNPRRRVETLPQFDRRYLYRVARNLAAALGALHQRGYVVGDLNESNILVTPSALVTLIDTDSFQVREPRGEQTFTHYCPVAKIEYTPPELQNIPLAKVIRSPEQDAFSLGVLIFQLLMEGNHPFRAQWVGGGDPPPIEDRIHMGGFPYSASPACPVRPPKNAPDLNLLQPELAELVRRCFVDGHADPSLRPDPATWERVIAQSEKSLVGCPNGHFYANHLRVCPFCPASQPATPGRPAERVQANRPAGGPAVGTQPATANRAGAPASGAQPAAARGAPNKGPAPVYPARPGTSPAAAPAAQARPSAAAPAPRSQPAAVGGKTGAQAAPAGHAPANQASPNSTPASPPRPAAASVPRPQPAAGPAARGTSRVPHGAAGYSPAGGSASQARPTPPRPYGTAPRAAPQSAAGAAPGAAQPHRASQPGWPSRSFQHMKRARQFWNAWQAQRNPQAGTSQPAGSTQPFRPAGPIPAPGYGPASRPVYPPAPAPSHPFGNALDWLGPRLGKSLAIGGGLGALAGALPGALAGLASGSAGNTLAWGLLWALGGAAGGMLRGWQPGYRLSLHVTRTVGWQRVWPVVGLIGGALLGGLIGLVLGWWAIFPVFAGLYFGAKFGMTAGRRLWEAGDQIGWERIWSWVGAGGAALAGWMIAQWAGASGLGVLANQWAISLAVWINTQSSSQTLVWLAIGALGGGLGGAIAGTFADLFARLSGLVD